VKLKTGRCRVTLLYDTLQRRWVGHVDIVIADDDQSNNVIGALLHLIDHNPQ
jgi:hypothetical protein